MLLKEKLEALKKFKIFKAHVENEKYVKIKCLRLDRGGEFSSREFEELCEEHGIRRKQSVAKKLQHNGVVERKSRTIQKIAKTMIDEYEVPHTF